MFCSHKRTHHQHNMTAILVDMQNHTYCTRCKDPDCNSSFFFGIAVNKFFQHLQINYQYSICVSIFYRYY